MIYYGKQSISETDIKAVEEVLRSDFLTQGPAIEQFERTVADYCGAKYAVAVCNATAALHIACLSAGLDTGELLWTSPITFVASANCGRYCGADVDFVDIDEKTYNMSAAALEEKLRRARRENKLPKVVIPIHLAGQSCDMVRIKELSDEYGFTIIEDASHAVGADYLDTKVGSCAFSDMTVFSFHPVKIVTTGEGGMVLTNNHELYEKLLLYRSHGITRNPAKMTHVSDGAWYYQQIVLGCNYRMTDIQAALGTSQMKRLDAFVARRRELAARYDALLQELPLVTPHVMEGANPSWHIYVVRVAFGQISKTKQQLFEAMKEQGIMLNLHYIPVHRQPYYEKLGFRQGDFPQSEKYYDEAFTLPLYYDLTNDQQDRIVESLRKIL
ncbi:UDP-4-amino-4,6-dideoxy-N-acetyl-beta-L-altrosamine transaminase [Selenomonas sp. oral taxon 920]|uniref:UDP-4-amino-4, 6-dideoxy-N-acetyl-beta-L-altrosamine transaminase n=1 Tax=Selenomonas sp. oral taxon 920 TaxID=1884263 RepID=UPI000840BDEC|nr:UDP-4-amino-4,6-dideoxy-N-acetyl-beta-L-altrosamine transaminase [Selenomonas sp. oral taxon 920]AOH47331.1 UDP-4-amino-4,6-dideoxy-N-acetyl-beta-L-altrosamine transaminase [Selenomonas sp. oral taxon 920]